MKPTNTAVCNATLLGLLAFLLIGCLPSLNPLYTEETTVEKDEIVGRWGSTGDDKDVWVFTKTGEKNYALVLEDKDQRKSPFNVKIVKLGDFHYLDLFPEGNALDDSKVGDLYRASLIPGHLFIRTKFGEHLEFSMMEPDWLRDLVKKDPKALAHAFPEKDYLIITATTLELQAFVKKHAKTEGAWGDPGTYKKLK